MIRRALVLGLAVLAGCSRFRPLDPPQLRAPPDQAIEVPFTEVAGRIVVPVQIGGQTRQFVVDGESYDVIVTPALAKQLGSRPRGVRYGGDFYGVLREWTPFVALPRFRVGGLEFTGGQAAVTDLDALSRQLCVEIDGVLVLQELGPVVEIDPVAGVVRVASTVGQLPARVGGAALPSFFRARDRLVSVHLATTLAGAIEIDDVYDGWQARLDALGVTRAAVVAGEEPWFVWPAGEPDTLDLRGVDARVRKFGHDMRLGSDVLRAFTIRVSRAERRLYANGRALPRGHVSFGFTWEVQGGLAQVVEVSPGTAALGLRAEARIVALDGQELAALTPEALCRLRRDWQDARDEVRVTVLADDGSDDRQEIVVHRRSLLADRPAGGP